MTSRKRLSMKSNRVIHVSILVLLLLLLAPVLIRQLMPAQGRHFDGVSLDETQHVEISFRNSTQQLTLGGLLFAPIGDGPFPAVVVIHGSGTSTRDNRWYLTLTQNLQENGVAVLLPDKRGSEKSEGNWRTSDFHDLATDTLAAIEYLKNQQHVAVSRIGAIGMSQGGWIAPLVASQSDDLDFVVSVVGAAVTPSEQLRYEENHNLRQAGFLPGFSNVVAVMSTAYIKKIGQKDFWDGVADYDPLPYWQEISVDAFALFGSDDTNVPSEESVARLKALDNPRIKTQVYAGSGHPLEDPVNQGNNIFRADALADIRAFIISVAPTAD